MTMSEAIVKIDNDDCQGGRPWSDSDAALSSTATTPRMKKQQNNISERMRGSEDAAAAALVSAIATKIRLT